MKRVSLTLLLLMGSVALNAQPFVAIRTDAQPREIYIGDPIVYGVVVTVSSDVAQAPLTMPQTIENFEILATSTPSITMSNDGKSVTTTQFILTTFSTGPLTIPAITLQFSTLSGAALEAKTEAIAIKVKSLLEEKGDEGNLRPLKGLFNFKSYLLAWILLGLLAAGVGGFYLWRWLTKLKRGETAAPSGPPRPPEELAWEAIHALEDEDLITAGQSKEFYYRLSVILREYLERRYGFSALDKTTGELTAEFRRQNFPLMLSQMGRAFLENADLVKFAKFTPAVEEITNDLNQVKQFINITTATQKPETEEKVTI